MQLINDEISKNLFIDYSKTHNEQNTAKGKPLVSLSLLAEAANSHYDSECNSKSLALISNHYVVNPVTLQ